MLQHRLDAPCPVGVHVTDAVRRVGQRFVFLACHPRLAVSRLLMHNGVYALAQTGRSYKHKPTSLPVHLHMASCADCTLVTFWKLKGSRHRP